MTLFGDIMHTQVLIVLAGILFCATTMQGRGLSYQEKRVSHQEGHKSKYGDKRYFIETARSLHRQKVQHLRQKLEHNRRDFDDEQKQFQDQMLEAINALSKYGFVHHLSHSMMDSVLEHNNMLSIWLK